MQQYHCRWRNYGPRNVQSTQILRQTRMYSHAYHVYHISHHDAKDPVSHWLDEGDRKYTLVLRAEILDKEL